MTAVATDASEAVTMWGKLNPTAAEVLIGLPQGEAVGIGAGRKVSGLFFHREVIDSRVLDENCSSASLDWHLLDWFSY